MTDKKTELEKQMREKAQSLKDQTIEALVKQKRQLDREYALNEERIKDAERKAQSRKDAMTKDRGQEVTREQRALDAATESLNQEMAAYKDAQSCAKEMCTNIILLIEAIHYSVEEDEPEPTSKPGRLMASFKKELSATFSNEMQDALDNIKDSLGMSPAVMIPKMHQLVTFKDGELQIKKLDLEVSAAVDNKEMIQKILDEQNQKFNDIVYDWLEWNGYTRNPPHTKNGSYLNAEEFEEMKKNKVTGLQTMLEQLFQNTGIEFIEQEAPESTIKPR